MVASIGWTWPRGSNLVYCLKVTVATLLGYLLSIGESQFAVYGAFTAALVVGASRGEDMGSAANRVRGSLAGMAVGVVLVHYATRQGLGVALGIGATAYLCMACGWGVAAARVGASLCAVTLLMHPEDAWDYNAMRVANTLIGIVAGLLVSHFVLPVRGRDAMKRCLRHSMEAVADLLGAVARPDKGPTGEEYLAVVNSLAELEKVLVDARREFGGEHEVIWEDARNAAFACIGAMTAALGSIELRGSSEGLAAAKSLREEALSLEKRARSPVPRDLQAAAESGSAARRTPLEDAQVAAQALVLGLRKVEHALAALGR